MHIPAFSHARYLRLVRVSGWYDLLVTWPFALPWTFAWLYAQLVVVVWSIARVAAPSVLLGRLDGVARVLFATWQLYAVAHGANAIVLGFTVFELLFGVLQGWRVAARRDDDSGHTGTHAPHTPPRCECGPTCARVSTPCPTGARRFGVGQV